MSSYKEGQLHQLAERLEKEGFTPDHLTRLGQFKDLSLIRDVLDGCAEIKRVEFVDLDADPFVPEGWSVVEHRKRGKFKHDPEKEGLDLFRAYQDGNVINVIVGHDLRKKLKDQPMMNANMLDYYLNNPWNIPDCIAKSKTVNFWGTVYRDPGGRLCVRCLQDFGDKLGWAWAWLDNNWYGPTPLAVFVD